LLGTAEVKGSLGAPAAIVVPEIATEVPSRSSAAPGDAVSSA
jgi:hypothetical protein